MARRRALVLYGGWEEHQPERVADFARRRALRDFEVVASQDLDVLDVDVLSDFDLLAPVWTFGELSQAQERALVRAVTDGLGLLTWHGATSAFLDSRDHKFLIGGQFVAHPGGQDVTYTVRFLGNDPLVDGLEDLTVTTEQYYLLVDPSVKVLATTRMEAPGMEWLEQVEMPVAWTRTWGSGRVFYCSLGHTVETLEAAPVATLLRRAARWVSRSA